MMLVIFAALALLLSDAPRAVPQLPETPLPWMEQGNRHARRRDRKLARG